MHFFEGTNFTFDVPFLFFPIVASISKCSNDDWSYCHDKSYKTERT